MMEIKLILLLIIAHLLSDFIFQPQKMSNKKERKIFSFPHIYHVIIVGLMSYILSFDIGFWKAAIPLTIIHLLIDMLKSWLIINNEIKKHALFFLDQLLHLIFIGLIVLTYSSLYSINFLFDIETRTIIIITGFIFCAKPSNIFINHLFEAFAIVPKENSNNSKELTLPNAGRLIGIVERFLVLALVILGEYEAVGLIIAAKSILRFNETQKSEYVLVGTLISISIAVFVGILIRFVN
ncbi:MAG: DUF3307 domain-containing protein [Bacteroidales bacterium]